MGQREKPVDRRLFHFKKTRPFAIHTYMVNSKFPFVLPLSSSFAFVNGNMLLRALMGCRRLLLLFSLKKFNKIYSR